jgi:hypothetical protein
MQILTNYLGTLAQVKGLGWIDPNLILGLLLMAFVLLVPKGLTGLAVSALRSLAGKRRGAVPKSAGRERTLSP